MTSEDFQEARDFFVTLSLAYRIHCGKEKKMLKTARALRARLLYPAVINMCDQFILFPDKTEFLINAATENLFGLQFLKIKRFGNGHKI